MRTEAYTSDAICQCMGIPSFGSDPACASSDEAIRLLLKPSFHPEICLTFTAGSVKVVCARWMIWRLFEPAPMLTDKGSGGFSPEGLASLVAAMAPLERPGAVPGIVIDGMPVDLVHFRHGLAQGHHEGNAGSRGDFSSFVSLAITAAWQCIENVYCRNALADAAEYVGTKLPRLAEPQRKPTIETVVLGPAEDRTQLLEALRRKHRDA